MRFIPVLIAVTALSVPIGAQQKQTYVGIVTDTMCGRDHQAMNHTGPEDKCVRDCVGDGRTYKYALAGKKGVYLFSDQETPARFAGRKVKVVGMLYAKTNILKAETIELAK
jgi:hypothetical protein